MPLIAALVLASASPSVKEAAVRAEKDVFDAEANAHLLMTSSQAVFKRMQWSFNRWDLPAGKDAASELFDETTALISRFRDLSRSAMRATDPIAPRRIAAAKSERVRRAARDVPEKAAKQLEEIFRMRSAYDADAARSALLRARAAMKSLEKELGPVELKPSQRRVLAVADAFRAHIEKAVRRVGGAMPPAAGSDSGPAVQARRLVSEEIGMLKRDAEALAIEAEKLALHYRLNSYLKTPEKTR